MLNGIRNLIKRFFASTPSNPAGWFIDWIRGGTESDSGVQFGKDTALRYPPIWYAVNKIAGHVGVMPLVLYVRQSDRERARAIRHPAYRLIKDRPSNWMSAHVFRETLTAHALLWGNGRAVIHRDGNQQPSSLDIIDPAKTVCVLIRNTETKVNEKLHVYIDDETHEQVVWPDRDVLHIQGLGSRGFEGYSVVELAKNSWGLGLAAERTTNKLFKNNAVPDLILEAPLGAFKDETKAKEFLRQFKEHHAGGGGIGLLREGIQAKPLTMSGRDGQWLEQRKFQRQEAALWMLLEQILGDDASVSYNSLEQKNLAYLTNCLLRWLVKWEQECNSKLLTAAQQMQDTHFFKFQTAALLRGTTKERYEVYQIGRQIEVLSANDVRVLEDMNPRDGGDEYANPAINPKDKDGDGETDSTFKTQALALLEYDTGKMQTLVTRQIRDLIHMEVRQIRHAAEKQKNFVGWLDDFYEGFSRRATNVFERCGGTMEMADDYAEESKRLLLESAGAATADELLDVIKHDTSEWVDRAEQWAHRILGE